MILEDNTKDFKRIVAIFKQINTAYFKKFLDQNVLIKSRLFLLITGNVVYKCLIENIKTTLQKISRKK